MELGKVAAARMLRREAQSIDADLSALETTVDAITLIPIFAYAVGADTMHVRFSTELDYDPITLDTSAWDVTIAANGGAPAGLTTTGSVSGASGLVVLSCSGTPFKLPPEEEQAISLTYTPSGTNDLLDAAGRTVAGFTYNSILPRVSDWRKAAYLLMAEQAGNPSGDPDTGYWWAFFKSDGLYVENSAGTVTGPLGVAGAGDGLGPDGDKGDVTVGGTGTTLTIDNNAVTYGKMQDMTTDRLLGRDTAGSGDPEELTVGGGIEFTGTGIQRSALTGAITASAGSGATSQVFSKGGTMVNSSGLSALTAIAWRAPFACTVTNVRGYRVGGSAATINARRNGTDNHLASNLSLGSADAWADGGAVQNTAYAAGDKLEIMLVSVTGATQVAIQVDFTRP